MLRACRGGRPGHVAATQQALDRLATDHGSLVNEVCPGFTSHVLGWLTAHARVEPLSQGPADLTDDLIVALSGVEVEDPVASAAALQAVVAQVCVCMSVCVCVSECLSVCVSLCRYVVMCACL